LGGDINYRGWTLVKALFVVGYFIIVATIFNQAHDWRPFFGVLLFVACGFVLVLYLRHKNKIENLNENQCIASKVRAQHSADYALTIAMHGLEKVQDPQNGGLIKFSRNLSKDI